MQAEPVAWMRKTDITELTDSEPETNGWTPLYAAPQAQPADALDATKDTVWIPLDADTIQQFATGEFNGDWWLAPKCYDSPIVGRYEWIQGRKPNGFNCGHTARLGVDEITHVAKYIQPEMPK